MLRKLELKEDAFLFMTVHIHQHYGDSTCLKGHFRVMVFRVKIRLRVV